jgi:hypothetical protein
MTQTAPPLSASVPARAAGSNFAAFLSLAVGLLFCLGTGFVVFGATGRDDSHISFWSAHALSQYGQIVNYNGERVEQSSSLLHVLILALLNKLTGVPIPTLGWVMSVVCGAGTIILAASYAKRLGPVARIVTPILMGTAPPLIYWTFGAMEAPLVALLGLLVVGNSAAYLERDGARPPWGLAAAQLGFLLVRPEAPFVLFTWVLFSFGAAFVLAGPGAARAVLSRKFVVVLGVLALLTALVFAGRLLYFGVLWPQPVYAKTSGQPMQRLLRGLGYISKNFFWPGSYVLWLPGCAGAVWALCASRKSGGETTPGTPAWGLFLAATWTLASLLVIALIGGDWMEVGRFMLTALPGAALMAGFLLQKVWDALDARQQPRLVATGAVVLVCIWHLHAVYSLVRRTDAMTTGTVLWARHQDAPIMRDFQSVEKWNRIHLRDITIAAQLNRLVGELHTQTGKPVTIMSQQAGLVMYYVMNQHFGEAKFIDSLGLTTRDFTSCSVTRNLGGNARGLNYSLDALLPRWPEVQRDCGIEKPEIIFDLSQGFMRAAVKSGYTVVYWQDGKILSGSKLFPGSRVRARQGIALRNDLVRFVHPGVFLPAPWREPVQNALLDPETAQADE